MAARAFCSARWRNTAGGSPWVLSSLFFSSSVFTSLSFLSTAGRPGSFSSSSTGSVSAFLSLCQSFSSFFSSFPFSLICRSPSCGTDDAGKDREEDDDWEEEEELDTRKMDEREARDRGAMERVEDVVEEEDEVEECCEDGPPGVIPCKFRALLATVCL